MNTIPPATRVLMIVENNGYPFDVRVRGEAESLVEAGYHVTVLCPSKSIRPFNEVINGVKVCRFPTPPQGRGITGYLWEFSYGTLILLIYTIYLMLREGFDVLHAYNPPDTVFLIGILAKITRKKFVYDHRDPSPELFISKFGKQGGTVHRILIWMERMCCRLADLVIAPNEFCRQVEMSRHGISSEKIIVVHNAPRLHRFTSVAPDPVLRARSSTILGYVGVMNSQDGIDYLFRSLHHLKYTLDRTDFFTVLIGPTDDLEGLQSLAESLEIEDHIQFTGHIPFGDNLLRVITAADICVEPAPSNPINNISTMTKLSEYMALRKPIVAYDLPGNHFLADTAALYARPNDEAEFAQQIARLMDSPDLQQRMGAYGRERAEKQFNWDISAAALRAGYRRFGIYDDAVITAGQETYL
jgi:glycosyltransferase involved in cell wall biosynthesis